MDRMTQPIETEKREAATPSQPDSLDAKWAVNQIKEIPDAVIRTKPGFIERFLFAIMFTALVILGGTWLAMGMALGFENIRLKNWVFVFGGVCLVAIIASRAAHKSTTNSRWILGGSVLLCILAIAIEALVALLGKGGDIDGGRLAGGRLAAGKVGLNIAALGFYCSPLLVLVALGVWWRQDRRLAARGLLAMGISVGLTVWGAMTDYLSWSKRPAPTDEITYLAGFFAMLGCWVVCLVYWVFGFVVMSRRR